MTTPDDTPRPLEPPNAGRQGPLATIVDAIPRALRLCGRHAVSLIGIAVLGSLPSLVLQHAVLPETGPTDLVQQMLVLTGTQTVLNMLLIPMLVVLFVGFSTGDPSPLRFAGRNYLRALLPLAAWTLVFGIAVQLLIPAMILLALGALFVDLRGWVLGRRLFVPPNEHRFVTMLLWSVVLVPAWLVGTLVIMGLDFASTSNPAVSLAFHLVADLFGLCFWMIYIELCGAVAIPDD